MFTTLTHKALEHRAILSASALGIMVFGLASLGIFSFFEGSPAAVGIGQQHNGVSTTTSETPQVTLYKYIEVMNGCGPYYDTGECVNMRTGPGVSYPVAERLRTGVVLKVDDTVLMNGETWYKIGFASALRYPERVKGDLYVAAEFVQLFENDGDHFFVKGETPTTTKRIIVDESEQMLYAYNGNTLFMEQSISTGLDFTPTPLGTFTIFKKTPSRYMQGPLPGVSEQVYDLPGVPWNLYFTSGGAVIHGAYWHDRFGEQWSHGCVNMPAQKAKELYLWADVGTTVTVRN